MIGSMLRSGFLAALIMSVGPKAVERVERSLGGKRAMAVRAHMAHRSFMMIVFRTLKLARKI